MVMTTAALCLALNIYHEARSEPLLGQHAVAQVTMNRAGRDPKNVCKVVFEPKQFSWTNTLTATHGAERARLSKAFIPKEGKAWEIAKTIAFHTVKGNIGDFTKGATFYHTKGVRPIWDRTFTLIATIGQHKFYRA